MNADVDVVTCTSDVLQPIIMRSFLQHILQAAQKHYEQQDAWEIGFPQYTPVRNVEPHQPRQRHDDDDPRRQVDVE